MHACIRIYIYMYIYSFQCICTVQTTLLLDLGFRLFWRCQSHQNLPQNLYHTTFGGAVSWEKGGERQRFGEQTTWKPLDLPSGWPILSCSCRHANFQTNANPRMFKYIDVLAAEILGTIVWHICFHETRAIQAQESRLKGHRFHMFLYIINKDFKQSEPWNSSILGNKYPTYLESSHIHKRSKVGTFLPNTSGLWAGLQKKKQGISQYVCI